MLRLLEFFGGKNSSPIFSKLVRARDSNPFILLVGTIKPYNLYYYHFLLRPCLGKIFAVPFHRAKMIEKGETVAPIANRNVRARTLFFLKDCYLCKSAISQILR